jgi:hypothetical protein
MVKIATSGGDVSCSTNKNLFSSNRHLEDSVVVKTRLFEYSDNYLSPSDSGLSGSYAEYMQKTRSQLNEAGLWGWSCKEFW